MYVREHITLLHLPTTSCILAFLTIGAGFAPTINLNGMILILALVEFFLGAGVASNYLDELCGRPWKTSMPEKYLWVIGMTALVLNLLIGVYLTLLTGPLFFTIILIESFIIFTYNLELFNGLFHNSLSIAVGGALTFLGGFYLQAQVLDVTALVGAFVIGSCSLQGIRLYQAAKPVYRDGIRNLPHAIQADISLKAGILFVNLYAITLIILRLI